MAAPAFRRKLLGFLVAAAALGPAGISGLIREALAAGATPVAPGLHRLRGTVAVNGQPAREGQLIRPGDTIVTGPGSEAIYVIGQDAFLQREKSTVSFAGEAAASVMRVIAGGLLSVFGKGERKVVVPTATIGIRGTACYIEATDRSVYFCLCYGTAEVAPKAEPGRLERIVTEYHDRPMMINDDPSLPTMWTAAVVNHSDAELTLLENLVGRWPPFYGKSGLIGY